MDEALTPLRCPACGHGLVERTVDDLAVDVCDGGCGGIWFDNGEIEEVDDRDEAAGEALARIEGGCASTVDHARKRACPRCEGLLMLKRRFGPRQPVEIDECPGCAGIWLDAGELKAIREAFTGSDERAQVEAAVSDMIACRVKQATAGEARKTRAFHAVAKFLGHMWHDYGLGHFRGREWPPWRGTFRG
jgi:Zn-finger nucleic acid-binding protein